MNTSILIGIVAGLASSALFASAWTGTLLGVLVLFFLSPMPVAIAGLGWGWASGAIAAVAGALVVGSIGGVRSGTIYALALGAPAAVFAYYTLLNRPVVDGAGQESIEWYPLGRLVGWACVWAGVLATLSMISIGGDVASIRAALMDVFDRTLFRDAGMTGGRAMSDDEKRAMVAMMTLIYPWAIATMWLTVAMVNWWIAGRITAQSGRLIRPWPDLSALALPPQLPLAFGVTMAASLVTSGMLMLSLSGFASAFTFALMLVGLGILHRATRGSMLRPFMLGSVYTALMILPFTILILALLGLAEPYIRHRLPPPSIGQPPT